MVGIESTSAVPPPPRGTPTSSTPGLFPNNVRRRLSSPGPSRFLSPLTVPKKRPGREDLARGEQQGAGQRTTSRKHIVFWCPRLRKTDGALSIEGQLMDENVAISQQSVYSTRVVIAKGLHIRVHGRSGTEYILEGKLVAKETSFPAIFHSINNTPDVLLNRFERGFPDNWTQLRDNWNVYANKQEEVPARFPVLDLAFDSTPAKGPVDTSTPYTTETASRARSTKNRRELGVQQVQLEAILEGENVESSEVAARKRTQRSLRGGLRAASKRRKSSSVPTRKSPRLEKQDDGDGYSEEAGHQMESVKDGWSTAVGVGSSRGETGSEPKEVTAAEVNGQQSILQCTKCQFKTSSKRNFERHMGSKIHKNKVVLEVADPADVVLGTQSKEVDNVVQKNNCGKAVPEEENVSVPISNSITGATVSHQEETPVTIFNRLNTSRATAREARTRCASMLNE